MRYAKFLKFFDIMPTYYVTQNIMLQQFSVEIYTFKKDNERLLQHLNNTVYYVIYFNNHILDKM